MKKQNKWYIHAGIIVAMLVVALAYFSPVMSGKVIRQGDTQKYEAMTKETKDYQAKTGTYVHWNSAMFSGMPAYQVGGNPPVKSVFTPLHGIGTLRFMGMEQNAGVLFFYLIGFYVALIAFGCSPWLSLLGALAFGLGSYNIIIVEAGHITKAWALAMMAPILAGMTLCFRKPKDEGSKKWKDWLWGGLLFTCALALQLHSNHVQITFYTIIGAVMLGITYGIFAIKDKYLPTMLKGLGILVVGAALAFACNARNLMVSYEYSKQTMRGGNAITVTPEDLYHDNEQKSISGKESGLDIDYAFNWSYGVGETYTLIVPGAMGGGSIEPVSEESASYNMFRQKQMPLYWGGQPFTSGPVYFGAIVIFLFILGLIVVRGPERWWLLAATLLAILMSWGHNFMPFNEWLFNHLPLYNKFRTPSMSLVLANVTMVLLGVLALKRISSGDMDGKKANLALYISGGITAGIILVGLMLSGTFSYAGAGDAQMAAQYSPEQWSQIQNALIQDRKALFVGDSWRSLIFVVLAFAAIWLYVNKAGDKAKNLWWLAGALMVLMVIDLWGVDRRYLNENNYVNENQIKLRPDPWDEVIDQYAAQEGVEDYRVLNLATNTFNDSKPAAFHHQIGGYSAVKMRRYQDIIDFYLSRHINMNVLAMLNARYVVVQNGQVQQLPNAMGNCWLVNNVKAVDNSNDEILSLNEFEPAKTAIVNTKEFALKQTAWNGDSADAIVCEHQHPYNPDYVKYRSHTSGERLAVMSEIYYEPDWFAYIDGKPAEYIRCNYILRGIVVPAGDHVIEFRNEAPLFHRMDTVSVIGSIVLVLLAGGAIFLVYRKKKSSAK